MDPIIGNQGFPKTLRLLRGYQFIAVKNGGVREGGKFFSVTILKKGEGPPRLGIIASRKLGGAVVRNRAKRLIREYFRRHRALFPVSSDIVVVAGKGINSKDFFQVRDEFQNILGRFGWDSCCGNFKKRGHSSH